tara:strand:+ start:14409 stop:15020 length:612 start_codon:yes stop_codon:yes gene_type:complete
MIIFTRYITLSLLAILFYSCGSDYSHIAHKDNNLIFYQNGQKKKEIILNNSNQIIEIRNFDDSKLSSKWVSSSVSLKDSIEYYGNGKIKTKGYLKDGNKHSVWSYFDRDGHLMIERYFSYGRPSSIWIWYDHHGNHHIEDFTVYEDFRDDGQLTRFYQSGKIKEIKNYLDNKLHGEYTLFNNDISNSLQFSSVYRLGKEITHE